MHRLAASLGVQVMWPAFQVNLLQISAPICQKELTFIPGSCWALSVLYSGIAGESPHDLARHLKERISTSYLDITTLEALTNPPTNKVAHLNLIAHSIADLQCSPHHLVSTGRQSCEPSQQQITNLPQSGILRKASGPTGIGSLVDVYGTLLASRLLVPTDASKLDPRCLSLHLLRRNVDNGQFPLPIFTAIQHGRCFAIYPVSILMGPSVTSSENVVALQLAQKEKALSTNAEEQAMLDRAENTLVREVRCLWYEFTPFEIGCDEVGGELPHVFYRSVLILTSVTAKPGFLHGLWVALLLLEKARNAAYVICTRNLLELTQISSARA